MVFYVIWLFIFPSLIQMTSSPVMLNHFNHQDRVSLINGSKDSISDVVKLLVKLMKQRLEELGEPGDVERQLRLVVPNSAIRMVIDMILEKVSLRSFI